MINLSLLLGRRPKLPPGGSYFLDQADGSYVVRLVLAGEESTQTCKQVGPKFKTFDRATAYRAWLSGEVESFSWGEGAA